MPSGLDTTNAAARNLRGIVKSDQGVHVYGPAFRGADPTGAQASSSVTIGVIYEVTVQVKRTCIGTMKLMLNAVG